MNTKELTEIKLGMSNFDQEIDEGLAEALKQGGVRAQHSAWDFCGRVYYEDGKFHEEVWTHGSISETLSADTLTELMTAVNNEYGYE